MSPSSLISDLISFSMLLICLFCLWMSSRLTDSFFPLPELLELLLPELEELPLLSDPIPGSILELSWPEEPELESSSVSLASASSFSWPLSSFFSSGTERVTSSVFSSSSLSRSKKPITIVWSVLK